MPERIAICALERIADPGSFGFCFERGERRVHGFVVRRGDEFFAYRNSCPHTGSPLDWVDHQFLDRDGALIQCATHDALFLIESGECILGPCAGASLEALPIEVEGGMVYLSGDA